ncbi:hypothetical protein CBR_g101 [Chara braunii]|uniref:PUA domain-containing protein n=1 Tax=Chara braunii TaxID=69332 RepID=A0A388JLK1_CHABU|nr:hypothetical protein CBR_g101 [Chara braunii]|eukprot:GBG58700.1 hypothetical protein CBR_g101 [Chara braunii]
MMCDVADVLCRFGDWEERGDVDRLPSERRKTRGGGASVVEESGWGGWVGGWNWQCAGMRPLDEGETKAVFEKLFQFLGNNLKQLIDRPAIEGARDAKDGGYCLRLHRNRVYYVSEAIVKKATNVGNDNLASLGTCIGKFTHSSKFRLTVTCLELLAAHAKYKVWLKASAEMSFLYGNHVVKSGLGRITESTPQYQGVVVYSASDIPLGFGVAAHSTQECRKLDPNAIVVLHQADVGEYLRQEDDL